jgi:hypothetical protein
MGGSRGPGSLLPPGPPGPQWSIADVGRVDITCLAIGPFPAGADAMGFRAIDSVSGLVVATGTPLSPLVSGHGYLVAAAFFNAGVQVSEWSPASLVTTI